MAELRQNKREKSLLEVVEIVGTYPLEAYEFVYRGLSHTISRTHGRQPVSDNDPSLHVSGRQLCEGLRDLALEQWGRLAGTVLRRWNILGTVDFGRIVFALVDNGLMQKTDEDNLDDFRNVYDFASAFEHDYRIPCRI